MADLVGSNSRMDDAFVSLVKASCTQRASCAALASRPGTGSEYASMPMTSALMRTGGGAEAGGDGALEGGTTDAGETDDGGGEPGLGGLGGGGGGDGSAAGG